MGNMMGNIELHDLAPLREDERRELNLGRSLNHNQYIKHVNGEVSESCLHEVPWAVRDCISLYERMDISFNSLTTIPVEIPMRLPHLSYVNLSHNQLTALPESFGFLFHLHTVLLNNNKLSYLPVSFVRLVKLTKIDLSHNALQELPEDIGKMKMLEKLNVCHNKLKVLPLSLGASQSIKTLLAKHNRFEMPLQSICNEGSEATIKYLRTNNPEGCVNPVTTKTNIFARVRGNQLPFSVQNAQSAMAEYIQSQTETLNTASRIKTPLLPPADSTTLDAMELRDKIIGILFGAAIGDAIGIATTNMNPDECRFHYDEATLTYADIIRDELRTYWKPGDWTTNFDQAVLVLDSIIHWAGVVDELDFAKRLQEWANYGFRELGDSEGFTMCNTITKVVNDAHYTARPHEVATALIEKSTANLESDEQDLVYNDCGCVCRAVVLGIPHFHDLDEVASNARRICLASHAHPQCISTSVMVAVLVASMLQNNYNTSEPEELMKLIENSRKVAECYLSDPVHKQELQDHCGFEKIESINVREPGRQDYVLKSLGVALCSLKDGKDFRSAITAVAMEGGNSNTNACLTGSLLGCKYGFSNLPSDWLDGLRHKQVAWLNTKINLLLDMLGLP